MFTDGYTTENSGRLSIYAIEPKVYVDDSQQFGFNEYAKKLNGRLAMIGFLSAVLFEAVTGHGIFTWLVNL